MKFDKFMEILFRILNVIIGILVIIGFCVSCFGSPVKASADELDFLTAIFAYEEDFRENLITVNRTVSESLNDSDLSDETKTHIRTVLALQELALRTMPSIYGTSTNPILPDSDTVAFAGSGATGLCKRSGSDDLHVVNFFPGTANIASSDFFNLVISTTWNGEPNFRQAEWYSGIALYGTRFTTDRDYRAIVSDTMGYFSSYNQPVYTNTYELYCFGGLDSPPTVSGSLNNYFATGSTINSALAGLAVNVSLPNASVSTATPWDYYNNVLLPYMVTTYPDVNNNYFVFPNGYFSPPTPDPTEPATFPNGGIYIDKQYNIGINIVYPTDESGQPITDASGETVTETQYIIDTSPLDGEYSFQMPTLSRLNMYNVTLPNPNISQYSDGITWIWNMSYNVLNDSGFMPVVMIVFALALFGFILWKLGG